MTIRQRIKSICKSKNISLNSLEKRCNLATGYISKLDKSSPSLDNICRIAELLGVSLDELVYGRNEEMNHHIKASELPKSVLDIKNDAINNDSKRDLPNLSDHQMVELSLEEKTMITKFRLISPEAKETVTTLIDTFYEKYKKGSEKDEEAI